MDVYRKTQIKVVILFHCLFATVVVLFGYGFWHNLCDGAVSSCIEPGAWYTLPLFVLLGVLRPLFFAPTILIAIIAAHTFSPWLAVLAASLCTAVSSLILFALGRYFYRHGARSWLSTNLPVTWQFLKKRQIRLGVFSRVLFFIPFDLYSLLAGVLGFQKLQLIWSSLLGLVIEVMVVVHFALRPGSPTVSLILGFLSLSAISLLPLLAIELRLRLKDSHIHAALKVFYLETLYEIRSNNEIVRRRNFDGGKVPVILLYGFFSSRKALTIMERLLTQRGFQVMSFNLGGLMGVFFTRGIRETALYVAQKVERQQQRYGFNHVHIIGHSKGGLVALWWLLKLGGGERCRKVITLGTPYKGTYLTYFGLFFPTGFIWRDLWQMRPGSRLLRELHEAAIPKDVHIYNLYSKGDKVTGERGAFHPTEENSNVHHVEMADIAHFEFLYRRDVADKIAAILRSVEKATEEESEDDPITGTRP